MCVCVCMQLYRFEKKAVPTTKEGKEKLCSSMSKYRVSLKQYEAQLKTAQKRQAEVEVATDASFGNSKCRDNSKCCDSHFQYTAVYKKKSFSITIIQAVNGSLYYCIIYFKFHPPHINQTTINNKYIVLIYYLLL